MGQLAEEPSIVSGECAGVRQAPLEGELVHGIHTRIRPFQVRAEPVELEGIEIGLGRLPGSLAEGIEKRALAGTNDLADLEQAQAPVKVREHVIFGLPNELGRDVASHERPAPECVRGVPLDDGR